MLVKREIKNGSNDLIVVYRPCTVDELLGNEVNKRIIKNNLDKGKVAHTLLLSGPSGCGKTTVARIIALGLNCESADNSTSKPCMECQSCIEIFNRINHDVIEINVGKESGKGDVINIVNHLASNPFSLRHKVIIFDEAHKLTTAAKDLLLKEMEDGYGHVYFIFCTNQPEELRGKSKKGGDPFLGRCTKLDFKQLDDEEIEELLINIVQFEGEEYNKEVVDYIVNNSRGVPRDAIQLLSYTIDEGSWDIKAVKQLAGQLLDEEDPQIIKLSQALVKGKWMESRDLYSKLITKFPTESIRLAVTGYITNCLKRAKKVNDCRKFSSILDIITVPIYAGGKAAEHNFYNYLFKSADIIQKFKNIG